MNPKKDPLMRPEELDALAREIGSPLPPELFDKVMQIGREQLSRPRIPDLSLPEKFQDPEDRAKARAAKELGE